MRLPTKTTVPQAARHPGASRPRPPRPARAPHRPTRAASALASCLLAAACAPPAARPPDVPDVRVDAQTDAPPPRPDSSDGACASGSHPGDAGCTSSVRWTAGPALPAARDHHTTFVHATPDGAYLYVLGGISTANRLFDEARVATLGADGTIGPWRLTRRLPSARAGHSTVLVGDAVYVTGGAIVGPDGHAATTDETWVSRVQPDGALAPWTAGPALPAPRFHHATVATDRYVYVIGGTTPQPPGTLGDVQRAEVLPDGSLGPWQPQRALPALRTHHAAVIAGGAIYVSCGLTVDAPLDTVLRAQIAADGTLGEWTVVSQVADSPWTHSSFVRDGALYLVGGATGPSVDAATHSDRVRRARLQPDGALGPWEDVPDALPVARAHVHQTPTFQTWVYSVGGRSSDDHSLAETFVGTFE